MGTIAAFFVIEMVFELINVSAGYFPWEWAKVENKIKTIINFIILISFVKYRSVHYLNYYMSENIIDIILSNPVYIGIITLLIILIVYAIIKKIIKLIFFTLSFLIIYTIYLSYTNQAVPKNIDELKENVSTNVDKFKSVASKSIDQAKKSTKNAIEKEIDKKIEKILDK